MKKRCIIIFFNYGLVIYNSKEPKPQKTNITTNRVKMTFLCTEIALTFSRSHPQTHTHRRTHTEAHTRKHGQKCVVCGALQIYLKSHMTFLSEVLEAVQLNIRY